MPRLLPSVCTPISTFIIARFKHWLPGSLKAQLYDAQLLAFLEIYGQRRVMIFY
jgi:hypothetical protein